MKNILVVDDELLIRWALREHLEDAGFRVLEAVDGHSALRHFEERSDIDAVILDLRLPDMDGIEILRRIKATCPKCQVIMMTAHGMPETANEAILLGARDFVDKPFDYGEMVERVEKVLD